MNNSVVLPVILAGGSGERLWPLSRSSYPKQFLSLLGEEVSLFQATLQRLSQIEKFLPPLVVCHEDHRFLAAEQARSIKTALSGIILEPIAKNTAPAIAIAARWAQNNLANVNLLILPADHYMPEPDKLISAVSYVLPKAKDKLVTFGIKADKPSTEYGYIEAGQLLTGNIYEVQKFIEKPNLEAANKYIKQGLSWNSGIFLFNNAYFLRELTSLNPEISKVSDIAIRNAKRDLDFIRISKNHYTQMPNISIDYAIMENTTNAVVTPLNCHWSDFGGWNAIWEHSIKDENNNAVHGDAVLNETDNCLINANHRLIATDNLSNLAIIETSDAVLVAPRDNPLGLKKLVEKLKSQSHNSADTHRHVMRPWGFFDSLYKGTNFQVKLLVLQVGKSISLQLHRKRSEHWVVVKGNAQVRKDIDTFVLKENESTFIPMGMKHQLINIGNTPLEVIEVQSGSYLGEDDIIRFEEQNAYA